MAVRAYRDVEFSLPNGANAGSSSLLGSVTKITFGV